MTKYTEKYLKYKEKYLKLKEQYGGLGFNIDDNIVINYDPTSSPSNLLGPLSESPTREDPLKKPKENKSQLSTYSQLPQNPSTYSQLPQNQSIYSQLPQNQSTYPQPSTYPKKKLSTNLQSKSPINTKTVNYYYSNYLDPLYPQYLISDYNTSYNRTSLYPPIFDIPINSLDYYKEPKIKRKSSKRKSSKR